jgi:hypothetical protein
LEQKSFENVQQEQRLFCFLSVPVISQVFFHGNLENQKDQCQGNQIGQIFAQWAIVYYVQCFENYRSRPHFYSTFVISMDYALILTQNGLGYMLPIFSKLIWSP